MKKIYGSAPSFFQKDLTGQGGGVILYLPMQILYFHKVFPKDTFSPAFPRGGRLRERILYLCGNAPPAQKQALPAVRRGKGGGGWKKDP